MLPLNLLPPGFLPNVRNVSLAKALEFVDNPSVKQNLLNDKRINQYSNILENFAHNIEEKTDRVNFMKLAIIIRNKFNAGVMKYEEAMDKLTNGMKEALECMYKKEATVDKVEKTAEEQIQQKVKSKVNVKKQNPGALAGIQSLSRLHEARYSGYEKRMGGNKAYKNKI